MSIKDTGYQSKRKNSSQSVEELISIIHMRDRLIEELRESVSHQTYISMCNKLLDLQHAFNDSDETVMKYQQWFKDHGYVVGNRPTE